MRNLELTRMACMIVENNSSIGEMVILLGREKAIEMLPDKRLSKNLSSESIEELKERIKGKLESGWTDRKIELGE